MAKKPINWIDNMPELLSEWNYERNDVEPINISIWSKRKVWWKCKEGHEWLSSMNNRQKKVGCPYCSGKLPIVGLTDLETTNPELLKEWDYSKNIITPKEIKAGSGTKVWWKCSLGHSWSASPNHRTKGRGCPICANKVVLLGYNDLTTLKPNIASEWDYEKNGEKTPANYTVRSGERVWWKCKRNHSWEAVIASRTGNKYVGCPYCSGLLPIEGETDLLTTNPELISEWNYEKNTLLTPNMVKAGSSDKVWWICDKGHEWQAVISSRTVNESGCPFCSGRYAIQGENDLMSVDSPLLKEWNYDRNGRLTPSDFKEHSARKIWWKCKKGHEWCSSISDRSRGDGCPYCSGKRVLVGFNDLAHINPYIAKEWNYEKNGNKIPQKYTCKSGIKVWWKCEKGHEWKTSISNRSRGDGCPKCNSGIRTSFPEQAIYFYVKKIYPDAVNRCTDVLPNGMEIDIFIPSINVGIEYDGSVWHESDKALEKEVKKYIECKRNDIFLIRVKEKGGNARENSCDVMLRIDDSFNNEAYSSLFMQLSKYIKIPNEIDVKNDRVHIQENYKTEIKNNSFGSKYADLVVEWDSEKNGMLTPYMFSSNSGERIWWKCCKNHSWQTTISTRAKGSGCPYCSGRYAIKGENDLQTLRPEIASEWNYNKNGKLLPCEFKSQSNKKVWWKCKEGHEWEAIIANRTRRGDGCPVCGKNP
ncbi:hypothetical protein DW721_07205 [Clostridium sp. AM27-31LB]|jgi:uncharacterized Zn-finger protein|uniref:zinc-ribbon domain-containing protein n=1 Tax=Clostridia TaxID=186801 RepID=UPI000E49170B|nr:zinc-ribbon domain-containing protein [Clostridium sp. AM27-31LB]RHT93280.1 hypothetical protein DW721_07205 [Clostridium sp. AM27-31LB]